MNFLTSMGLRFTQIVNSENRAGGWIVTSDFLGVTGWGATKQEALTNLQEQLEKPLFVKVKL